MPASGRHAAAESKAQPGTPADRLRRPLSFNVRSQADDMTAPIEVDWTAVGGIATALALVLGIGTLYWQHRSQMERDEHDRSRFALDSCLTAYRTALQQLEDGNNDRVTWVTSARMIQRANELASLVSEAPHVAVLGVEKELFRNRAAAILGYDNAPKGAWFFRGSENPARTGSEASDQPHRRGSRHRGAAELSLDSIGVVYELPSFPKDYEEPLPKHRLDGRVGVEMRAGFPGLFDYLTSRTNPGGRNEV